MLVGSITPTVIRVQEKVDKAVDKMILTGHFLLSFYQSTTPGRRRTKHRIMRQIRSFRNTERSMVM